jgi:hypothetical protein
MVKVARPQAARRAALLADLEQPAGPAVTDAVRHAAVAHGRRVFLDRPRAADAGQDDFVDPVAGVLAARNAVDRARGDAERVLRRSGDGQVA